MNIWQIWQEPELLPVSVVNNLLEQLNNTPNASLLPGTRAYVQWILWKIVLYPWLVSDPSLAQTSTLFCTTSQL